MSIFDSWIDWLGPFLTHHGAYAPILLLVLEEAGLPLPVPSDVILAYTGYQISQGVLSYSIAFGALLASVLTGSSILYYLSSKYGKILVLKLGHYLHLNEQKLLVVEEHFKKYGPWAIIFGRHIPGFRIPITVFAGISGVSYKTFIISTFISVVFWIAAYLSLGERLGPKTVSLLHTNPLYLLVAFIPFIFFICSIAFIYFKNRNN